MLPLPLTIISGYLGAGKTTLINRLLAEDHGMNLMVIVNDFGAINIDAALIEQADEDMIALTNGCICCTMDADLFMALNAALDRHPRPDYLIVESSGVADPAAIAAAAISEREIGYGGIITLVDALNAPSLLADPIVAPQVEQQIKAADMVLITKSENQDPALFDQLTSLGARNPAPLDDRPLAPLLFDLVPLPRSHAPAPHPAYTRWQHDSDQSVDRATMGEKLASRPEGMYRLKGFIKTDDGGYAVHVVGQYVEARRAQTDRTTLVGLGPADRISSEDIENWWAS